MQDVLKLKVPLVVDITIGKKLERMLKLKVAITGGLSCGNPRLVDSSKTRCSRR